MAGIFRCLKVFLVAALAALPAPASAALPVDLELVLAVDVSGSIDEEEANLQRDGYVAAIADPRVVAAIRSGMLGRIAVTYFEWAGEGWQSPVIGWRLIRDAASARAFAAELTATPINVGPWTSIGSAVDYAVPLFAANDFEGTRRVIDISGDGPNNSGRMAPAARDNAVRKGVIINGLPIMNDRFNISRPPLPHLDLYYKKCVIGGPGAFIVVAQNFGDFARAIRRKLILEIAGLSPATTARSLPGNGRARLIRVASDAAPPCDIGEQRFRGLIWDQ
jgi:hypothetical protein